MSSISKLKYSEACSDYRLIVLVVISKVSSTLHAKALRCFQKHLRYSLKPVCLLTHKPRKQQFSYVYVAALANLIPCPHVVIVPVDVNPAGNVGALLFQGDQQVASLVVKSFKTGHHIINYHTVHF